MSLIIETCRPPTLWSEHAKHNLFLSFTVYRKQPLTNLRRAALRLSRPSWESIPYIGNSSTPVRKRASYSLQWKCSTLLRTTSFHSTAAYVGLSGGRGVIYEDCLSSAVRSPHTSTSVSLVSDRQPLGIARNIVVFQTPTVMNLFDLSGNHVRLSPSLCSNPLPSWPSLDSYDHDDDSFDGSSFLYGIAVFRVNNAPQYT